VIVVNRFRVPVPQAEAFRDELLGALEPLQQQRGHLSGRIGHNDDDPELWVLVTEWDSVGAYRRALSAYDVKVGTVPTLSRALDEPSAYVTVAPGEALNIAGSRSLG
jgi:quinol monooxygenase YgiN